MNKTQLVSADSLSKQYGVKLLCYGPPGTGKTPLSATAPRPILLSVETGRRSLKGLRIPAYPTRDPKQVNDFFDWVCKSAEAKEFDTICIDSISEICDMILLEESGKTTNLQRAYGKMAAKVQKQVRMLLELKSKHVYMIAKRNERLKAETEQTWPMLPGKVLSSWVPHEMDEIYYIDRQPIPGLADLTPKLCYQTHETPTIYGRSRSSAVAPFEKPNLSQLFDKITKASQ